MTRKRVGPGRPRKDTNAELLKAIQLVLAKANAQATRKLAYPRVEDYENNPARFRKHLQTHGLIYRNIGDMLGVTGRTVQRWASGETDLPYADWIAILALTGDRL